MPEKRDYYEILGIPRDATDEEIKKSFRQLAFKHHPDHNHDQQDGEKFKEVNEAYQVLSDIDKRAAYDQYGHSGAEGLFGRGFEGFDLGGFGDIFDTFFGGSATSARRGPQRGSDLHYNATISFEEAALGCQKEISVMRAEHCSMCNGIGCQPGKQPTRCPNCNGIGQVQRVQQSIFGSFANIAVCPQCHGQGSIITDPCPQCRGTGMEKQQRTLSVKMPAGVNNESQIRLKGEGHAGKKNGRPGDMYITLSVAQHPFFQRQGDDIIYELPINFAQAALGADIEIPTIEGNGSNLKVPGGSQTGKIFRLKNKGIAHLRRRGRGDQLVTLRVTTPDSLNKKQRQLLKELGETLEPDGKTAEK